MKMLTIRKNTGFKLMKEGENLVVVTKVELVPSGKPIQVKFEYTNEDDVVLKETVKLNHPVALEILGKRCDIALGGTMAEGTEIQESQIPDIFLGKTFLIVVKHVTKGDKTYANMSYIKELIETVEDEEDDL